MKLVPAESDINTYSLFPIMDYCLTVRGTIGMESAALGIPVITAGTGRYDHKGFTLDSDSQEDYLDLLRRLETISPLSAAERTLAEKFAHGVFLLRPLPLSTVTVTTRSNGAATAQIEVNALTREDWLDAEDLDSLSSWVCSSSDDDFLYSGRLISSIH